VRPVLTLFATIDHRFIDGADGAKLAAVVRAVLSDPKSLEQ
jgi:pyruvate/2-oxoglutarate dehydrogenase complex dihydrolipoamide acyltransferase (E2) component